ncbi:MAG TPA: DUF5330 domain-containing protein [Xanthobacteraceae bacterium]|nr:DUF5330 domain-containing protein [Xanthobacteraceae bacterium]
MFFLLRMTFWIGLVLVLLPSGGKQQDAAMPSAGTGAIEAVSAASATVADMRQFCTRQADACAAGSQAAVAFGQRAQAGARMVYDFISERTGPRETGSIAAKPTKPAPTKPAAAKSQDTLTAVDLATTWRGPRRDAHTKPGT